MSQETKFKVEIYDSPKPRKVPKAVSSELKGAASAKAISRMKKESVNCPVVNKEVAFLYAQFLASTTMQIYATNSGSGVDPNRYSTYKDQRVKDVWGPLVEPTMKSLQMGIGDIKVPQAAKLYEALLNELSQSWAGAETSAQAYDRTMAEWNKIMKE